MAKAIVLILSFFVCVNVSYSQDVTVTEVDPSSIIQGDTLKIYAMGTGSGRQERAAISSAESSAISQLLKMENGLEFEYINDKYDFVIPTSSSGSINSVREAVYPLSEDSYESVYLVILSSEVNHSELNTENLLAFETLVILEESETLNIFIRSLRTVFQNTMPEAVKQFADSKGIELSKGRGYVGDIDMYYNDDDMLELSYVMLLDVE